MWNDKIKLAIEEKKASYRKCLQNNTVENFTENRKQAIVWKQWRDDWENCV